MKEAFKPSEALIKACENLLVCTAFEQHVASIVVPYENAILQAREFLIAPKWAKYNVSGRVIDRDRAYLMDDVDRDVFHRECIRARDVAGLKSNHPEGCPLLEAKLLLLDAENTFVDELGSAIGMDWSNWRTLRMAEQQKLLDLGLRLVAPNVSDANTLLGRFINGEGPTAAAITGDHH